MILNPRFIIQPVQINMSEIENTFTNTLDSYLNDVRRLELQLIDVQTSNQPNVERACDIMKCITDTHKKYELFRRNYVGIKIQSVLDLSQALVNEIESHWTKMTELSNDYDAQSCHRCTESHMAEYMSEYYSMLRLHGIDLETDRITMDENLFAFLMRD